MSVLIKNMEIPEHCGYCRFRYDGICHALQKTQYSMNECPLIEVPEPQKEKTGKWLDTTKEIGWPRWTCSACGGDGRGDYMFCPWCGARMVD